jgi:hypothetical protein
MNVLLFICSFIHLNSGMKLWLESKWRILTQFHPFWYYVVIKKLNINPKEWRQGNKFGEWEGGEINFWKTDGSNLKHADMLDVKEK